MPQASQGFIGNSLIRERCARSPAKWVVAATVAFAAFVTPQRVFAETPPAATDDGSKELMRRGFAAMKKNDFEAAREAFVEAWRQRQHFAIALSLAEVEMRLDRHVEAAEHWQYVLGNLPNDLADQRSHAQAQLAESKARIGTLTLQVKPDGASIYVDGRLIGNAPLNRELYFSPGDHDLYVASAGQRSGTRSVRMAPGSKLSLEMVVATPSAAHGSEPTAVGSQQVPAAPHVPPSDQAPSAGRLKTPILISGAVLTVASAALGTVFALRSNAASEDAQNALAEAVAASDPSTDSNAVCGVDDRPLACDVATARLGDRDSFRRVAIGAFIASGAFAVATATTYLFWPNSSRTATAPRALVTPSLAPRFAGVAVSGSF